MKAETQQDDEEPEKTSSDIQVSDPTEDKVFEFDSSNEAIQKLLEENEDLKKLIIAEPGVVEDYIKSSPKLKKLFQGINIKALSIMLRRQDGEKAKPAKEMTDEELLAFIDGNEGLRRWLLEQPEELASNLSKNPKLQAFLEGVDIRELSRKYKEHRQ